MHISQARTFFRLDPGRALRIYDLLASCGWVNTGGQGAAGGPGAAASGGGGGGPLLLAGSGEVGAGASEGEVVLACIKGRPWSLMGVSGKGSVGVRTGRKGSGSVGVG